MKSISLQILNPKVIDILQNLSDLNLIRITDNFDERNEKLNDILNELRDNDLDLSLEDIQKEVKKVRNEINETI